MCTECHATYITDDDGVYDAETGDVVGDGVYAYDFEVIN